jgi:hypothetical protein
MAIADAGARVTLFDRNAGLLTRAAVANEGKIHLGYMYAGDRTLNTARMMMQGALSFAPFLSERLGVPCERFKVSDPAVYVVHRESLRPADEVGEYFFAVHSLVQDAAARSNGAYFGIDLASPVRRWSAGELEREIDADEIRGAFTSPEVAIDPVMIARLIRNRIEQTPTVEVRLEHTIVSVEGNRNLEVVSQAAGATHRQRFDHVVNALWDGRLAVDSTRGLRPDRPWLHRLKYGVGFRAPGSNLRRSITVVLGPFGEVVSYGAGSIYLTWYPYCLRAITSDVQPPDWPTSPAEPLRSEIIHRTFDALARILPALRSCDLESATDVVVRGGPIVAWGETDIDDPSSELHRRFEIGVTSVGNYHTVDPGKLTMAPFFAAKCAARIAGSLPRSRSVSIAPPAAIR